MQECSDWLPSIFAVPYAATCAEDKKPLRREYQRVALEYALGFNAAVCLCAFYAERMDRLSTQAEDAGGGKPLDALTLNLSQMSLGTWNAIGREVSKKLARESDLKIVGEIHRIYHGRGKKWTGWVNELIKLRNSDAHGHVIGEDKLKAALDKRQELLNSVLEGMDFYRDFKVIVPYDVEVKDGKTTTICRGFYSTREHMLEIDDLPEGVGTFTPYLYHEASGQILDLSPMVVCHAKHGDPKNIGLFLYSKTTHRKAGNLHYNTYDASMDVKAAVVEATGGFPAPETVCRSFASFRVHVEDPKWIHQKQPSLKIGRGFERSRIGPGEDATMTVSVSNGGDEAAEDIHLEFDFPRGGFVYVDETGREAKAGASPITCVIPSLAPGERWSESFRFRPIDSGQYEFQEVTLTYSYVDYKNEEIRPCLKQEINVETAPPMIYEVYNPDDPDSHVPILNLHLSYDKETPTIGERIAMNLDVKNIGRSVANDVDICILPPKERMQLVSGSPNWTGSINPGETVPIQFVLRPKKPGIFAMKMRDIIYRNQEGDLFITNSYEDYKILVRDDAVVSYRFLMQDIWKDLVLDDDEKDQIRLFDKKFKDIPEAKKLEIRSEAQINRLRELVGKVAEREQKNVAEIATSERIAFCLGSTPFFLIDYKDRTSIDLYLKGDLDGRTFPVSSQSWRGRFKQELMYGLPLARLEEKAGGLNGRRDGKKRLIGLKGLISQSLRWVDNHGRTLELLATDVADSLGLPASSVSIDKTGALCVYQLEPAIQESHSAVSFMVFYEQTKHGPKPHARANLNKEWDLRKILMRNNREFPFMLDPLQRERPTEPFQRKRAANWSTFAALPVANSLRRSNRRQFVEAIPAYVLRCNRLKYEAFCEQQPLPEHKQALEFVEAVLDGALEGGFTMQLAEATQGQRVTFHTSTGFPLFKPGSEIVQLHIHTQWNKPITVLYFRNLSRALLERFGKWGGNKRDLEPFPYAVRYLEETQDLLKEAIQFAISKTGQVNQDCSWGVMRELMADRPETAAFGCLLRMLAGQQEMGFDEVESGFVEAGLTNKISKLYGGASRRFNRIRVENPVHYDSTNRVVRLNEHYVAMVRQIVDEEERGTAEESGDPGIEPNSNDEGLETPESVETSGCGGPGGRVEE